MMKLSLPYGKLPTREQFNRALLEFSPPHRPLRLRKDSRLGSLDLTHEDFWCELQKAHQENTDISLRWCCEHLSSLNIEWS